MAYSALVEEIQQSLNAQYPEHANYPLVVDGLIGPKTCGALFKLQKEWLGNDSSTITMDTIITLDTAFTNAHLVAVQNKCKAYYPGGGGPAIGPIVEGGSGTTDPLTGVDPGLGGGTITAKKSKLPLILLGGALGGGLGYMAYRNRIIKSGSAPMLAGAGAGVGALTFWFFTKPKSA